MKKKNAWNKKVAGNICFCTSEFETTGGWVRVGSKVKGLKVDRE